MRRGKAKMSGKVRCVPGRLSAITRSCAARLGATRICIERIGTGHPSAYRGRLAPLRPDSIVRRCAIGALVLAVAMATGCGRGEGAIAGATPGATYDAISAPAIERQPPGPSVMVADERDAQPPIFYAHDTRRRGVIHADLVSVAADFRAAGYDTLVVHVQSASVAQLVARVKSELAASRQVVLDSDGDERGKTLVSEIARAATGGGPKTEGVLISMVQEGVYAVTPLETVATYQRRQTSAGEPLSAGNTARYALGID